jgi:hypothetical protein
MATSEPSELPSSAYRLGVDADGDVHYHDAFSGRLWLQRDGEIVSSREWDDSASAWVEYIGEVCGWERHEPVGERDGLTAIARDVLGETA